MMHRTKLFAALLPIAAIGFLATENTASTGHAGELSVVTASATLETAPYGRASIRGARPAPEWPFAGATATATDTVSYAGHPRRQNARSLPQTGNGFVLAVDEPRSFGPRGARG